MLFSALVMRCVRKIDLEYENGKQLQVTIIKITEITDSKEDNSIHRLDVSISTSLGGAGSRTHNCTRSIKEIFIPSRYLSPFTDYYFTAT